MVAQYNTICKSYKCNLKLFTQTTGRFKEQIGSPDLVILFTNTVSHTMVNTAIKQAKKNGAAIARSHSSSASALKKILATHSQTDCHKCKNTCANRVKH